MDTNARRIHIDNLNYVQDEGERKYQEDQMKIIRVVHEKEIFSNDETINRNLIHLPVLFGAELQ